MPDRRSEHQITEAVACLQNIDPEFSDFDRDTFVYTTLPPPCSDTDSDDDLNGTTECFIALSLKHVILETIDYQLRLPKPKSPCCKVREAPASGLGLFATRDIKAGELILAERAIMITPSIICLSPTLSENLSVAEKFARSIVAREKILQDLLARTTHRKQAVFQSLFHSQVQDYWGEIFSIQRTNGFALGLSEGTVIILIYPWVTQKLIAPHRIL